MFWWILLPRFFVFYKCFLILSLKGHRKKLSFFLNVIFFKLFYVSHFFNFIHPSIDSRQVVPQLTSVNRRCFNLRFKFKFTQLVSFLISHIIYLRREKTIDCDVCLNCYISSHGDEFYNLRKFCLDCDEIIKAIKYKINILSIFFCATNRRFLF